MIATHNKNSNEDKLEEQLSQKIAIESDTITVALEQFSAGETGIIPVISLLEATKPHLLSIKAKVGANDVSYLRLSTKVVKTALNHIDEVVKDALNVRLPNEEESERIKSLIATINSAWEAMELAGSFDMDGDFYTTHYQPHRTALREMYVYIDPKDAQPKQMGIFDAFSAMHGVGCLIQAIVVVIAICLLLFV